MPASGSDCAPLAPTWAFVLQLREGTSFDAAALRGRIEHIASGKASDFASLEEVRVFMQGVMEQLGRPTAS